MGGSTYASENTEIPYADVEIFGCPTAKNIGKTESDFFLTGLALVEDDMLDKYFLLCGGSECHKGTTACRLSRSCHEYRPGDNVWREALPLELSRLALLIAQDPLQPPGGDVVTTYPLATGYRDENEIKSLQNGSWTIYQDIPSRTWETLDCFIQFELNIYYIDKFYVTRIDPYNFNAEVLASVPEEHAESISMKCTGLTIKDVPGIFTLGGQ